MTGWLMLTQAEQDRLAQLTSGLAGDPARAARQLAASKTKVDGHIARLDRLFASISDETANNLRRLAVDSDAARRRQKLLPVRFSGANRCRRSGRRFGRRSGLVPEHFRTRKPIPNSDSPSQIPAVYACFVSRN
jgi:hypothetical protein